MLRLVPAELLVLWLLLVVLALPVMFMPPACMLILYFTATEQRLLE
jgi:hypothetical protein